MTSNIEIGLLPDEQCNRDGCTGVMQDNRDPDWCCSCHINPPCSYCTANEYVCDTCGANVAEEYYEAEKAADEARLKKSGKTWQQEEDERQKARAEYLEKRYVLDDGCKYEVCRYFDDIFEAYSGRDMKLGDANKLCDELNAKPRHYVYYSVQKQS